MKRHSIGTIRPGYRATLHADGFVYNTSLKADGTSIDYWREGPYYEFSESEVLTLETAVTAIYHMCKKAGEHMVAHPEILLRMGIPDWAVPFIQSTWDDNTPNVYGRFDLAYDGSGTPKLLEFNADTPTSLFEGAFHQWRWFEYTQQGSSQWNSIEEQLIEAWRRNIKMHQFRTKRKVNVVHFAWTTAEKTGEDLMTVAYLAELAEKAAAVAAEDDLTYRVEFISIEDIGVGEDGRFYDLDEQEIELIFKLHPWEWLVNEKIAETLQTNLALHDGTVWVEPIFKMMWSNKYLLVVLWELFKDDPEFSKYLLPAFEADSDHGLTSYVEKPYLAREGANTRIVIDGVEVQRTEGVYGEEGYVVQQYVPLPSFEGLDGICHPVLGTWVIDGDPAGMGIRESVTTPDCAGLITKNDSFFVSHVIA